jgi:hypothetical protein
MMQKNEKQRAIRSFEKEISKKAKKDPKAFYKYVNSKLKSKDQKWNIGSTKRRGNNGH